MKDQIEKIVLAFEKASAEKDIKKLNEVLHPNYRVIANRFRDSENATLISREQYLNMTEAGKIGGTSYDTDVINIDITEHTAMAEVLFKSKTASDLHKYLFLVQNRNGKWQVVSDLPLVIE